MFSLLMVLHFLLLVEAIFPLLLILFLMLLMFLDLP